MKCTNHDLESEESSVWLCWQCEWCPRCEQGDDSNSTVWM